MAGVNGAESEKMDTDPPSLAELTTLLEKHGLNPEVIKKIEEIHRKDPDCLKSEDLDDRALDALKDFPVEHALDILDQFKVSSLGHVTNKSSYLCGVMKAYRQEYRVHKKGPDEAKIKEILERTKYPLEVTTGQRKYGGPPPDYDGPEPGPGQEVFCGKLPKDVYEDELIPLFEKCGKIWDLRIMMNPLEGQNKGYCFVTFCDRKGAENAVAQLNDYEIRKEKKLKCNVSIANTRLFVGNIPKDHSEERIMEDFGKFCDGIKDVIVYKSADNKEWKNRGFAFLDFDSHKNASAARRKILKILANPANPSKKKIPWNAIVDWADPQEEPDDEIMSKVKVLFVSNLTSDVTEEVLKEKFSKYGELERVKKLSGYAFIHFEKREDAENALKNVLIDTEIGKNQAQVSLAKPQSENAQKKKEMRKKIRQRPPMFMGGPPFMGDRDRGRFGRGPWGGPDMYSDYNMYGGYDQGYAGGYFDPVYDAPANDDGYGDPSYGWGYRGGPPRGRGGPRGVGMRGPMGMRRPRRGMPVGRGRSGMPAGRGGPPMRGGRGARGGMGAGDAKPPMRGGGKRKAGGDHIQGGGKRRNVQDYNNQNWGETPIPQQPLQQSTYDYQGDDSQWYTDSFGGQNWN
ncbi:heterogeneous nuclear ribonucleoprotein R-like isoform X2 [Lineus longissimus]|uniref:heterogeneous nuclear ribonucleoprotein R-like isoform X2 n=1 Tax=Lineus longissimus TaxID=88925 RepID=UPI00315C79DD